MTRIGIGFRGWMMMVMTKTDDDKDRHRFSGRAITSVCARPFDSYPRPCLQIQPLHLPIIIIIVVIVVVVIVIVIVVVVIVITIIVLISSSMMFPRRSDTSY